MSNLRARAALERARNVFLQRPSAARFHTTARTSWTRDGLRCETVGPGGERVITDLPAPMGGGEAGAPPTWLLRASLASCTATSIAMRAALRGIALSRLEVEVEAESDARGVTGIDGHSTALHSLRIEIRIGADAVPETQLREIAEWAATQAPVVSTLRQAPSVNYSVNVL